MSTLLNWVNVVVRRRETVGNVCSLGPFLFSLMRNNEFVNSGVSTLWSTQVVNFTIGQSATVNAGSVTFQDGDGNSVLGTAFVRRGKARFATGALSAGSHTVRAVYSGDNSLTPSSGSASSGPKITRPAVISPMNSMIAAANGYWTIVPSASS